MKMQKANISFPRRVMIVAGAMVLSTAVPLWSADVPAVPEVPAAAPATQPADKDPAPTLASIKASFADLANSDASVRSEALTKLMGLTSNDLPALKKVIEESRPLAPAQATVLRQIVMQVYLSGVAYEGHAGMGFLGIIMKQTAVGFRDVLTGNASVPTVGVIIVERMPGFCGARMLRDGDVILSILNHPEVAMDQPEAFRSVVTALGGGATAHFLILREGQIIHVDVKLDPRPMQADPQGFGITEMLERRREQAELFWDEEFAALATESVS